MTTVDTNVLLRIIVGDDERQAARASACLDKQDQIFVPKTVLLEAEWVLRGTYHLRRADILLAFRLFLDVKNVEAEDGSAVAQALRWYEHGMDFADSLHLASGGPEYEFVTLDAALQRIARRLQIRKVIGL